MHQSAFIQTMTFDQFTYTRPDMAVLSAHFAKYLTQFQEASTPAAQSRSLSRINALRESFSTMYNLCIIRHTANTADPYYAKENEYFDQTLPDYEALNNQLFQALLASPFRDALEEKFGKQLFSLAELAFKTFKPAILENLQEENRLSSEYTKIKAQAKIDFKGQTYNLSSIQPLELSDDRTTRREASEAQFRL